MSEHVIWTEKYRPQTVDECVLPSSIKNIFKGILKTKVIPNLLLYGSPGGGKTSVAKALCKELEHSVILVNGSLGAEESGIDAIRTKVRSFASTVSFNDNRKVVIIDEADYSNPNSSQPALRGLIEEFASNCSFIFTCNNKERIIPAIQSRCTMIEFKIDKKDRIEIAKEFVKRLFYILNSESITHDKKVIVEFVMRYFNDARPDFRKIIIELQKFAAVNGTINEGLLSKIVQGDANLEELCNILKNKNFNSLRKWVVDSLTEDSSRLYRKIYDHISPKLKPQSIPPFVIFHHDYLYKSAFVVDQEINLLAYLTELIVSNLIEFV